MMNIAFPPNAIMCFSALCDVANMNVIPKEYSTKLKVLIFGEEE